MSVMPWGLDIAILVFGGNLAAASAPDRDASFDVQLDTQPQKARYGQTNAAGVNIRTKPSMRAPVVVRVKKGTLLEITDESTDNAGDTWYAVIVDGRKGFIRGDLIEEVTEDAYREALKPTTLRKPPSRISPAASGNANTATHQRLPGSTVAWCGSGDAYFHYDNVCPKITTPDQMNRSSLSGAEAAGYKPCSYCWCVGCMFVSD